MSLGTQTQSNKLLFSVKVVAGKISHEILLQRSSFLKIKLFASKQETK